MSAYTFTDSATMLRRSLRHTIRYPVMLVVSLAVPILLLLLFAGVFGGAMRATVAADAHGASYLDYIVPGVLLMTVGYGCSTTALAVNRDMTEGIIARFKTMRIAPASILTGHVAGAVLRTLVTAAVTLGVAMLMGFRPHASALGWLGVLGVVALLTLALTWLSVGAGLAAKKPEGTTGFTLLVQLLPFVSSGFVPTGSMNAGVRWFAHNQPFSPVIDTLRGLLLGTPLGNTGYVAVAWCAGLTVAGFFWARALFKRDPSQ